MTVLEPLRAKTCCRLILFIVCTCVFNICYLSVKMPEFPRFSLKRVIYLPEQVISQTHYKVLER